MGEYRVTIFSLLFIGVAFSTPVHANVPSSFLRFLQIAGKFVKWFIPLFSLAYAAHEHFVQGCQEFRDVKTVSAPAGKRYRPNCWCVKYLQDLTTCVWDNG